MDKDWIFYNLGTFLSFFFWQYQIFSEVWLWSGTFGFKIQDKLWEYFPVFCSLYSVLPLLIAAKQINLLSQESMHLNKDYKNVPLHNQMYYIWFFLSNRFGSILEFLIFIFLFLFHFDNYMSIICSSYYLIMGRHMSNTLIP